MGDSTSTIGVIIGLATTMMGKNRSANTTDVKAKAYFM
jgi:hypothetical protein